MLELGAFCLIAGLQEFSGSPCAIYGFLCQFTLFPMYMGRETCFERCAPSFSLPRGGFGGFSLCDRRKVGSGEVGGLWNLIPSNCKSFFLIFCFLLIMGQ